MLELDSRQLRIIARLATPLLSGKTKQIAELLSEKAAATPSGVVALQEDQALSNLQKIEHIVVVMLENRSFDCMLGDLSLSGGRSDVDGLTGKERETYMGHEYRVHPLAETAGHSELEDPCHSGECVDEQMRDGFVASYAKYIKRYEAQNGPPVIPGDPGYVMGYYDANDLPVYHYLASEFCICDRWFSSVGGATWPNRLYALTGGSDGSRDDLASPLPLYNRASFLRFLDHGGVDWRWYSYDPATLRMVDAEYRLDERHHHHFAFLDKRKLSIAEDALAQVLHEQGSFLDDAAAGTLPAVSWIDPHFKDLGVFGPDSNDDHPPSDVIAGQALVLDVYHALRTSPCWEKTLLIVTYDEHGGFHDHVVPPPVPDDHPDCRHYGIRVPAIVVSPFVERASVEHDTIFDHTSIIKMILARFCRADGAIPDMGTRVNNASHLGCLLTRTAPRTDIADYGEPIKRVEEWRASLTEPRYSPTSSLSQLQPNLTDLQHNYATATRLLRAAGLPAGHP